MLTRDFHLGSASPAHIDNITAGAVGARFLIHALVEFEPDSGPPSEDPLWQVDLQLEWGNGSLRAKRSIINDGDREHAVAFITAPITLLPGFVLVLTATPNAPDFAYFLRYWIQDVTEGADLTISTQQG